MVVIDSDGQHSRTSYWRTPYVRVTFSSRMQHDPADIPKLIAPILAEEADMVNGSRYIGGNGKNTPAYRRVGQTVLDKATNLNSGLHIIDLNRYTPQLCCNWVCRRNV